MRVETNTLPQPYEIKTVDGKAFVFFAEDITERQTEDGTMYSYEQSTLECTDSVTLPQRIEANYDVWLAKAKVAKSAMPTIEQRVTQTEDKVVTLEETIDVLFGGGI